MGYRYKLTKTLEKDIKKISKKDKNLFLKIEKKINEIINCEDINHYKNLQFGMKKYKRVHIGSFVLIFSQKDDIIIFKSFKHHDFIYK